MPDVYEESLVLHEKTRGKIEIRSKVELKTKNDLSLAYTPGVAAVSREIAKNPKKVYNYTMKSNSVAVLSDGSAVLGLGNIGPEAALPVMEGKAALFKEFGGIDAIPICLKTQDPDEIVKIAKNIAPVFGGINLEDISAPRCFEIEEQLQDIGIPVMHDDQHGTAITILAALINACKAADKRLEDLSIVISGAGAAGTATAKLLLCLGYDRNVCTPVKEIVVCDSKGIIYEGRGNLEKNKNELAALTNKKKLQGNLEKAVEGKDVFIGLSTGNILTKDMVRKMVDKPIIFAMANPVPEIMPHDAAEAGAFIIGTGRSDMSNQINNALAFPGVFRGALDAKATRINNLMKIAAAYALASCIAPSREKIVPDVLDKSVHKKVAEAVRKAAINSSDVRA
ncbi:MAG: NADP-dependent malic enzyme [Candidatus Aenigmarchaeota archaeon]|nr:NADP-dependent malic enzyme [Candidatus Aenigmarchaeota archaeon]